MKELCFERHVYPNGVHKRLIYINGLLYIKSVKKVHYKNTSYTLGKVFTQYQGKEGLNYAYSGYNWPAEQGTDCKSY